METRRMCPHCRAFITTSDRVCPYCDTKVGPRAVDRREPGEALAGFIPHARFVTVMIMVINFGLYAATVIYSMRQGNSGALMNLDGRTLFDFGAKLTQAIALGQWWRLITAGFLHGGLIHILMNSWVLFDLGSQVEEIYGWARLIVFYLAATVLGFYASAWWSPSISIGASAGIFGLLGAMIALGVRHKSPAGAAIRSMYMRWAMFALLMSFLPGVDMAAHIGGLAAGFAVAYVAGTPSLMEGMKERLWQIAAYGCIAITAYSFFQMYLWFSSSGI